MALLMLCQTLLAPYADAGLWQERGLHRGFGWPELSHKDKSTNQADFGQGTPLSATGYDALQPLVAAIPPRHFKIEEVRKPVVNATSWPRRPHPKDSREKILLFIQDIHADVIAQEHIHQGVELLMRQAAPQVVATEGYFDPIDLSLSLGFPHQKTFAMGPFFEEFVGQANEA